MKNTFFTNLKSLFFSHNATFILSVSLFIAILIMTLTPKGLYLWIIFAGVLFVLIPWYKYIDTSAIFICLFGVFYGIFVIILDIPHSTSYFISYFIVPLQLYCLGRWFTSCLNGRDNEFILLVFTLLLSITSILLYRTVIDVINRGIISVGRNFEIEGVENITATIYGVYAALTMVGFPMFFASIGKKTFQSWLFLLFAILGTLTTIHLVNRTGLVIAAAITLLGIIYRSRANIGRVILLLCFIIAIVYILIKTNIIPHEVIDAYKLRNDIDRQLEMSAAGGRGDRWLDAITRIFYMPLGWYYKDYLTSYTYVHNWLLDVGRVVGIIPLFLLLIPTIISIKNCFLLFQEKNNNVHLLLLVLNTSLFLATFVEPVMEGCVMIAYFYFFVWGMTSQVVKML